jgi:hypothetical protein
MTQIVQPDGRPLSRGKELLELPVVVARVDRSAEPEW